MAHKPNPIFNSHLENMDDPFTSKVLSCIQTQLSWTNRLDFDFPAFCSLRTSTPSQITWKLRLPSKNNHKPSHEGTSSSVSMSFPGPWLPQLFIAIWTQTHPHVETWLRIPRQRTYSSIYPTPASSLWYLCHRPSRGDCKYTKPSNYDI
jgi:hypothetical protein